MAATEPVWIIPAGAEDERGDTVPVEADAWWYVPNAVCIPRRGREANQGGIVAIAGHEIFVRPVPPWADEVAATATILLRGEEHEVDGEPAIYKDKALQIFTRRVGT